MSISPEILELYLTGNNDALNELYFLLKSKMLLTAYYYTNDKQLSQDITHDIFEKLLQLDIEARNLYFGAEKSDMEAWIHVAVKHKALDTVKIKTNREKLLYSVRSSIESFCSNESLIGFTKDGFEQMMKKLEPRESEIIRLHLNGYSNDEISQELQLSYATVKNNIYEARKKIKLLWSHFIR
jgi:RNA polymerase sigma factor (sigma-70 family)